MKNLKIAKKLGALTVGAVLALGGAASVYAAESAAGVKEAMDKTIKSTQEALEAAKAGNEHSCLASIKQAKQYYKEITGDAAGKPLQDAIKRIKEAQVSCETEGGAPVAVGILTEVVASMEKIKSGAK